MLCQYCKHQHDHEEICPLDPTNYDKPETPVNPFGGYSIIMNEAVPDNTMIVGPKLFQALKAS